MRHIRRILLLLFLSSQAYFASSAVDSVLISSSVNTVCYDSCLGSSMIEVFSAFSPGPFRIIWKGNNLPGGQIVDTTTSTDTIFNLCAGEYTVEVIDLSDTTYVFPVTFYIPKAPALVIHSSPIEPSCHDSTNGSILVTAPNAPPPIHWQWSTGPNDTLNVINNLGGGVYGITLTDDNGCTRTDSVFLRSPDSLRVNVGGTDVSCKNVCDGTVFANPSGGTASYTYLWNNSDTNPLVINLCPDTFSVVVTDANGCRSMDTVIITESDSLLATFDVIDPICHDQCDGQVIASANGGKRPFTYHWSGYQDSDSSLDNACAGLITASITDANGCYYTENITLTEPQLISLNPAIVASSCGNCDGEILLTPSGGTGPYRYMWISQKPQDTISSIDSLCAGIYQVLVTDASLCTDTFDLILSDDTSGIKDIGFLSAQTSCATSCDGALSASAIGGLGPYTYLWMPGSLTDSSISGLCSGEYTIEITDVNACKRIETITLTSESNIQINLNSEDVQCKGSCDGEASAIVSGGKPPYSYSWNGIAGQGSSASGLCEGPQAFQVSDANACLVLDTINVSSADSLFISSNTYATSCYNSCDGAAKISLTGGKAPFTYSWSNGLSGDSISGLCKGSFSVSITDANGCQKNTSITITSPAQIQSNPSIYPSSCQNGGVSLNSGAIKLNPSGGLGPYQVVWANNTIGDSISCLYADVYSVDIWDANGCHRQDTFVVSDLGGPQVSFDITGESCYAACDAQVVAQAVGPGSFVYSWKPQILSFNNHSTVAGLCAGTIYSIVTENNSNCKTISPIVINAADEIQISFDHIGPSCQNSCDGSLIADVNGGLPPYTYSWSNGSSNNGITDLCGGSYSLTVTDASGCSVTKFIDVSDPDQIDISLTTSNLTCYDVCDGRIYASTTGGSGVYTYTWSTGATTSFVENLCAGSYWVQVDDENGCSSTDTISIANGIPITVSFIDTAADCGQCNGSLTVSASGGNGIPYSFKWSDGSTGNYINGLIAGIYSVTVMDNSGCEQSFQTSISNVGGPTLMDSSSAESCFNTCDGKAFASASGGLAPYFYQWNDANLQTGDSAIDLCPGTYLYSASDSLGCISYDSVEITSAPELLLGLNIDTDISCPGDSNGIISSTLSGNQGSTSYLWSTGDTLSSIDSLPQGTYWLSVNDTMGCSNADTVVLQDPIQMSILFALTSPSCFNSCDAYVQASVTGGRSPYTYSWNDPQNQSSATAFMLCPGYTVLTITDANSCTHIDSVLINAPNAISLTPTLNNPTCNSGSDGSIVIVPSGGQSPYQISWDNGMIGSSISGLSAGVYTVTVIDDNNCVFETSYTLTDPSLLTVNINITSPICGEGNGSASAIASGGSGSYSFLWNTIPNQNTSTANNLWAGAYTVTVTDNNTGCAQDEIALVNDAAGPNLTSTIDNSSCLGATVSIHAGVGIFSYEWNGNIAIFDSTTQLGPGLNFVKVTNLSTNCISFDTVLILADTSFSLDITTKAASCYGSCDGSASVAPIGGLPPYVYSWFPTSPPETGPSIINQCPDALRLTVDDSLGCSQTAAVVISGSDSISINVTIINNALCANSCSGLAQAIISGGTAPYAIFWNGISGNDIGRNLCPGPNILEVTDFNGCSKIDTVYISDAIPILSNAIVANPSCGNYDGSIELSPSGGNGPYFYNWSHGPQTSSVFNLFAGIYTVEVSDINGCSESFTFFLSNPNAPVLSFDKNTVKCNGDCNGVARVTTIGGVSPFSYLWDYVPVSTEDSLTDLCSGAYFVKVTDATGCIAFGSDSVFEPEVLDGAITKIMDGCGGKCEGEAAVAPIGGTQPYSFVWNTSPPQSGVTAVDLCEGTVVLTITDNNSCVFTDSIAITPPPELVIDSFLIVNASCFTNADGEVTAFSSGGLSPYSYLWTDFQTTQTAITLNNGLIAVLVTDQNSCTVSDTVSVAVTDTVLVEAFVDSFACFGDDILLSATGNGATIFNWFEDSLGFLTPLGSGTSITYTVTDSAIILLRGQNDLIPPCFDIDTNFIIGIPLPAIDAGPDVIIEEGDFTQLLASPFLFNGRYAWTPSIGLNDTTAIDPIARPLVTTVYTVIGTNEFGCSASDDVTVSVVENDDVVNGFSPNGDGVNDYWELPFLSAYPSVIVEVFNRWGISVFRSDGYNSPWDGTFEGNLLPSASYYYVIDYYGDGKEIETGAVTILY